MRPALLAALLLVHTATAQQKPVPATVGISPGIVVVRGIWRPDNETKKNKLIPADDEISCFSTGGKELVGTAGICFDATASTPLNHLNAHLGYLKVVEWSNTQIIAVDDSPDCLTSQIIFDLKSKTVMSLDVRKPNVKGLMNVCEELPDRQTYYLQDETDYYSHTEETH